MTGVQTCALPISDRLPETVFRIVGSGSDKAADVRDFLSRARAFPNLSLEGYVGRADIDRYFFGTRLVICTSVSEGFPNTFLEAWASGTPVVSTVDPDGVIGSHDLGRVCGTLVEMVDAIRELTVDPGRWRACSQRCLAYIREHHHPGRVLERCDGYLDDLVGE